jgi:heme/copper-type cytochrome/quinol oxidase subunit 1
MKRLMITINLLFGVRFGDYMIRLQASIGAQDMAFTRLNNVPNWILPPAIALFSASIFVEQGMGWTLYVLFTGVQSSRKKETRKPLG